MNSLQPILEERILVVDDDESIREIISSMLTHAGYDCRAVSSGQEAIAALQSDDNYALLLSDLAMEGMDGFAVLDRVEHLAASDAGRDGHGGPRHFGCPGRHSQRSL